MIIPSIDIYKNKVVRLYKGNIKKCKEYGYFKEYINFYVSINIKKIHIVLLDNIFYNIKKKIKINKKIKTQIGGGIYSCDTIIFYLNNNFKKFVLGSVIFKNKKEFKKMISIYKKKIIISLDCINKIIIINGWKTETKFNFKFVLLYLIDIGIKEIIYTNIMKDGTLSGFKKNELEFLDNKKKLCIFFVSGGVKDFTNLFFYIKKKNINFIVGVSLYKFIIKINQLC